MKKKPKPLYSGIAFDSDGERDFYWWCEEALQAGFIESFVYHPESYQLLPRESWKYMHEGARKTQIKDMFLLNPCRYQLDFIIKINPRFRVFEHNMKAEDNLTFHIDIKGDFSQYNDDKYFSIVRRLVYHKTGIFVNKVVAKEFFQKTFCPARSARTPTGRPRKDYKDMLTVRRALTLNTILSPPYNFVSPEPLPEAPDLFNRQNDLVTESF